MSTDDIKTLPWARLSEAGALIDQRIRNFQEGALANRSAAVAALARLRRGAGKPVGSVNDILEYTMAAELAPTECDDEPTAAENAAHVALTLYATHQQSQSQRMHQRGHGLGRSIRSLLPDQPTSPPQPVQRRFQALGTADTFDELVQHLRGIVQLLRAKHIPLDYGLLVDELIVWQRDGGASRIRLRWGRDFFRTTSTKSQQSPASL